MGLALGRSAAACVQAAAALGGAIRPVPVASRAGLCELIGFEICKSAVHLRMLMRVWVAQCSQYQLVYGLVLCELIRLEMCRGAVHMRRLLQVWVAQCGLCQLLHHGQVFCELVGLEMGKGAVRRCRLLRLRVAQYGL